MIEQGGNEVNNYFAYHLVHPNNLKHIKIKTNYNLNKTARCRALCKNIVDSYQVWNVISSYLSAGKQQQMSCLNRDLYRRSKQMAPQLAIDAPRERVPHQ